MRHRDDPRVTTTSGREPTTDGGAPEPVDPKTGQHGSYWVLTEGDRAKGFIRPVRSCYVHVGPMGPLHELRDLTAEEKERHASRNYVKYETYPDDAGPMGRFWTQDQLDGVGKGCGVKTTMTIAIAETYARDPKFYGFTFCCGCKVHFPVSEFIWDGTEELVGS
jgi:hypothetical protein